MEDKNQENQKKVKCVRCNIEMQYKGTKSFHEGTRWGVMGDIGELFVNKEKYDIYVCPNCGVVEFFVDQIEETLRPQ